MFHCESESTLLGLPKEDTTINRRLSYIYNTVPEQFNPNIRACAAHLWRTIPGRVAYNAGLHKGYKVGQFQLCKDSLTLLTHSL